jgi:hypothetical protein
MAIHHPIPSGLFCVPTAICALTGADPAAAVIPAINRAERAESLLIPPEGVHITAIAPALRDLGYVARRYRKPDLFARLSTWARRSLRYPGRGLLVCTAGRHGHAVAVQDGRIYDNHAPRGTGPDEHPFSRCLVDWVALVERLP